MAEHKTPQHLYHDLSGAQRVSDTCIPGCEVHQRTPEAVRAALRAELGQRFITHGTVMDTRHHQGYGHGLAPGTTRDINCQSCTREDAPPEYTGPAEDEGAYEAELYAEAADDYDRYGGP